MRRQGVRCSTPEGGKHRKNREATRLTGLAAAGAVATTAILVTGAPPASAGILPGYHQIMNHQSKECLDVTGAATYNGAEVKIWRCVNADNQRWSPEPVSNGQSKLRVAHTGKCLSVQWSGSDGYGSNVVQDDCNDPRTSLWRFGDEGNGWSSIVTQRPDTHGGPLAMCLDKSGGDVTVWGCHSPWWQEWQSLG
ncbi:RICIN domain-containing protein [Streptomyces sp. NPDC007808]|uniref:RICIN domain-containing protein n=1 Tax=Streptomyces sp. NPDC007808 TaxID=3364779 RepID=UPI00367C47BB